MNFHNPLTALITVSLTLVILSNAVAQQTPTVQDQRSRIQNFFGSGSQFRPLQNRPKSLDNEESQDSERFKIFGDRYRTIDGSLNNLRSPLMGTPGTPLLRLAPQAYLNGVAYPARNGEASARRISNLVCDQTESQLNDRFLTDMVWQWGQFIDHDIDLTETAAPAEAFPIHIPKGDMFFDPNSVGGKTMLLFRSQYDDSSPNNRANPRQQVNSITAWIDASNVYGSDTETMDQLRLFWRGLMKTSPRQLLPIDEDGFYMAGDVRANEQVYLTAMHTLFVREHNRLARIIYGNNNDATDEKIFQQARREVIGIIQSITFNEFLPALLGRYAMPRYLGYRPGASANISNEFATAAYRFGHSMLNSDLQRINANGTSISAGPLPLQDAFFNPTLLQDIGIDPYLRGLCFQQAQEIDTQLVDDVRNFLFGRPGSGGFDLASLNIQRGREHGLSDYNTMRVSVGLRPVHSFEDITSDPNRQISLLLAYDDVDTIDPWVGLLAEDHVRGASMGRTARSILRDQFRNLRDADRFWYQRDMSGARLRRIEATTLASVIRRNTRIKNIQRNVFFMQSAQP